MVEDARTSEAESSQPSSQDAVQAEKTALDESEKKDIDKGGVKAVPFADKIKSMFVAAKREKKTRKSDAASMTASSPPMMRISEKMSRWKCFSG